MTGRVENLQALVPVPFRLPGQPDITIEFVVDTSFTAELALPSAAVAALQLPYSHTIPLNLADASEVEVNVHTATIVWDGDERMVRVLAVGRLPRIGAELLAGCELVGQFIQGGLVTIESILPV